MKFIDAIFIAFLMTPTFGMSQIDSTKEKPFRYINSLEVDYLRVFPLTKEYINSPIERHWGVGIQANIFSFPISPKVDMRFHIGGNYGGKNYHNLIDNVSFEGGYTGGLRVDYFRGCFWIGSTVGFQAHRKFRINFPFSYAVRWVNYSGIYYLHDFQSIKSEDLEADNGDSGSNIENYYRKFSQGFKTGVEISSNPSHQFSLFARLNLQFFGERDVFDVESVSHPNNGPITFDTYQINNSSEIGFSLGVRVYVYRLKKGELEKRPKEKKPDIELNPDRRVRK
ncbi:MAG: hypothetical protein WDZ35_08100 [Crocinitomicaceae bacterium]